MKTSNRLINTIAKLVQDQLKVMEDKVNHNMFKYTTLTNSVPTDSAWPFPKSTSKVNTVTELATQNGIKFVHYMYKPFRYTVAFRPVSNNGKMIELAIAYTHPKDTYVKKIGAQLAAERFFDGLTIKLPLRGDSYTDTVYNIHKAVHAGVN